MESVSIDLLSLIEIVNSIFHLKMKQVME